MTMGEPSKNGVRTSDLKECQEILDVFFSHGHKELDTARVYAEGTTEPVSAAFDSDSIRAVTYGWSIASGQVGSQGRHY